MKRLMPFVLLGFGVALAFVIGERMSTDAMAVVVGVAVGVAASIPTSVLLVAMQRRERAMMRHEAPPAAPFQPMPPQVIVVDPSRFVTQQALPQANYPLPPLDFGQEVGMRRLRIIGGEDD